MSPGYMEGLLVPPPGEFAFFIKKIVNVQGLYPGEREGHC